MRMYLFICVCILLFLGTFLFVDWIMKLYKDETRRLLPVQLPLSDDENSTPLTNNNCTAEEVHLSLADRVEVYQKTFEANGNQLLLTKEHLVTTIIPPGREEGEEKKHNDASTTAIDIELGDDNTGNNSDTANNDVKEDTADVDYQPDHCSGSTAITNSLCLDHTTTAADKKLIIDGTCKQLMVNGTCIICFEEFKKDDIIVWSEDSNCNHIYHKECMVSYLASNSLRNDQASGSSILNVTNPCPTCRRQNYCIVRNEDVPPSITTTTTTTNQIMAVIDSPLEEHMSSSTTEGSNNNSSTNTVTSTTATATATNNNITMINNNEIVTVSDTSSDTVSMTINTATVPAAVNTEVAVVTGLRHS